MTFKDKVLKVLMEHQNGANYKDIKEEIVKEIKVDIEKVRTDAQDTMDKYFKNLEAKIKDVVKEVIKENPNILKKDGKKAK